MKKNRSNPASTPIMGQPAGALKPAILVCLAVIVAFRLWLSRGLIFQGIPGDTMDDHLFIDLARNILTTGWLGDLDKFTLVKGPFYSLFLAGAFLLGLPVILAHQLLLVAACLVCWWALRPLFRNEWVNLLFFTFLVFNPSGFANHIVDRSIREGIYAALIILVFGCASAILIRFDQGKKVAWGWPVGLGLSLAALFLTREERFWVYPFLSLWLAGILMLALRNARARLQAAIITGLPFAITAILLLTVILINGQRYGLYAITESDASSYQAAFGALLRVKPPTVIDKVPVTRETRALLYPVSPKFSELEPYLEGEIGKSYVNLVPSEISRGEILGAFFNWALIESVDRAGYYSQGKYPDEFYQQMADEINRACDTGTLDCHAARSSLASPWRQEYLEPAFNAFLTLMNNTLSFKYMTFDLLGYESSTVNDPAYEEITREVKWIVHDKASLWGWAVLPGSTLDIRVTEQQNHTVRSGINFYQSEDVHQYYLERGQDVPEARMARFKVDTSCLDCYLEISNAQGVLTWIPIDEGMTGLFVDDPNGLSYRFESYSEQRANTSEKAVSFRLITRLNRLINRIADGIQFVFTPMIILAALAFIWQTILLIRRKRLDIFWVVSILLLSLFIPRLAIFAYVEASLFLTEIPRHITPLYPLAAIFAFLNCAWLAGSIREITLKRQQGNRQPSK
jgi:hypothetical protein